MHELGICDALLKMVEKIAEDEQLDGIRKITVEVGTLSGVVPKYLEDCWIAVTDGTPYMNSEFAVEVVEGTAKCFDCGQEFLLRRQKACARFRARPDPEGDPGRLTPRPPPAAEGVFHHLQSKRARIILFVVTKGG